MRMLRCRFTNRFPFLGLLILMITLLTACGQAETAAPTETVSATQIPVSVAFPLSEPGPYFAGNRVYSLSLVDESRGGREIRRLTIWYPALEQLDDQGRAVPRDAEPDMSGAPYPLILTEFDTGTEIFLGHLASHGFTMAVVLPPDIGYDWGYQMVDHPRDFIFSLDQIASHPPEGLEGVIDTDHAGVTGYSGGGLISLAVSGVRIDPEAYLAWCADPPDMGQELPDWYLDFVCALAGKWDDFEVYAGEEITAGEDGLWQPITDDRIRAVMPMAPDGAWLYGERGLAAADRPMFIIEGAEDEQMFEAKYIFDHVGSPDRTMVSFLGKSHMMVSEPDVAARMNHFVTAFFGYYLQGREDYAQFFSESFVSQFDDLRWEEHEDD